jgi:succinate dehydrogenase/fumarate reductase cytochrome b subunit
MLDASLASGLPGPDAPSAAPAHPSDARLLRVQAASGAIFAVFALLHLLNQMVAALGPAAYDRVQRGLRRAYQAPVLELVLVIAPLLVHVGAAVTRMLRRRIRHQRPARDWPARLHRASGLFLLVFILGHVTATRGASLVYSVYPEFAGVAFTLQWVPAYFYPYYLLLGLAGFYHAIHGLRVALPVLGVRLPAAALRRRALVAVVAVGSLLLVAGWLGFTGLWQDVSAARQSPYAQLLMRLGFAR